MQGAGLLALNSRLQPPLYAGFRRRVFVLPPSGYRYILNIGPYQGPSAHKAETTGRIKSTLSAENFSGGDRCEFLLYTDEQYLMNLRRGENMRSDRIKKGIDRAPHRSLPKATGPQAEDCDHPRVGLPA